MKTTIYKSINERIYCDYSNDCLYRGIVMVSKTDEVKNLRGDKFVLKEGDYVYLYEDIGEGDYIVFEGYIIPNTFNSGPCKWFCKLVGEHRYIEYWDEYNKRFGM